MNMSGYVLYVKALYCAVEDLYCLLRLYAVCLGYVLSSCWYTHVHTNPYTHLTHGLGNARDPSPGPKPGPKTGPQIWSFQGLHYPIPLKSQNLQASHRICSNLLFAIATHWDLPSLIETFIETKNQRFSVDTTTFRFVENFEKNF